MMAMIVTDQNDGAKRRARGWAGGARAPGPANERSSFVRTRGADAYARTGCGRRAGVRNETEWD